MRGRYGWAAVGVGLAALGWAGARPLRSFGAVRAAVRKAERQARRGSGAYQVIMWSTGQAGDLPRWIARLRELGCTAEECGSPSEAARRAQNQFGFYAENLVPELAYLHDREALYNADFRGYQTTHEKRYLVRRPCFDDPVFWQTVPPRVQAEARAFAPYHPLLVDLRDEASLGRFVNPMDYCFGPWTLRAFRQWLHGQYRSLAALNREWGTTFPSWDAVTPFTTYEVKARERAALRAGRPVNYAPWADHRAYMDLVFARTVARLRDAVHAVDPAVPVGIEGAQMPSAWGGYDLWRLSQAVDWIEPYDVADSRVILRSFLPPGAPVYSTVFGSDLPRLRRRLWWLLLQGDRGCIVWDDTGSRCVDTSRPAMPLTARGRALAPLFAELKAAAPRLFRLRRVDDGIAIHYSQPSIRAHWMFDSRGDGETWPRRLSSYEATHSRLARVRDSFLRVVEDLGLQARFLAAEPIENGRLRANGCRVLLLPESVAMSARECRQVAAFVRAGGTVIADSMTATMDEHCRPLPAGQLDALFGIHRGSEGARGRGEDGGTGQPSRDRVPPAGRVMGAGTGRAGARVGAGAGGRLRRFAPSPPRPLGPSPLPPLPIAAPGIAVTTGHALSRVGGVPAVIEHRVGQGRAVYLNLDLREYGRQRLRPPGGSGTRELFRRLLARCGVRPAVRVVDAADGRPVPCVEIERFQDGGHPVVALMRSPELDEGLRQAGYPDNRALEQPVRAQVLLPRKATVTDLRTGRALGVTDRVSVVLDPWSPTLLALR